MQIVIVDDEDSMLKLLTAVCRSTGHDTFAFKASSVALEHLKAHGGDLLITDIVVPPFDGLSLIARAKAVHAELEAIAITGYSTRYRLEDSLHAGASDLLIKPFQNDELALRVTMAAKRRRAIDKLHTRRDQLQQASTEMIRQLQEELTAVRRLVEGHDAGTPASARID